VPRAFRTVATWSMFTPSLSLPSITLSFVSARPA
jgi:hypothetical protein